MDKHHNIIYRTLIYAIAFTGMRPGEAVALKYEDVDLEKKVIHINKTVYAKKSIRGYFELTPPKTAGDIRSVDIDDIVVEKLKRLYKWREYREWAKSDFVFGDKEGIPYRQNAQPNRPAHRCTHRHQQTIPHLHPPAYTKLVCWQRLGWI